MNHDFDSNDPVWKLLDRASPVEGGPFFARNAVRRIRQVRSDSLSWILRWATPLAFATLAVGFLLTLQPIPRTSEEMAWDRARGEDFYGSSGESPIVTADMHPFFDAAAGLDDLIPSGDLYF